MKEGVLPQSTSPQMGGSLWDTVKQSPLFWTATWIMLNIGLTLLNKSVFQFVNFHYPLILSAAHMLCTYMFCFFIFNVFKLFPVDTSILPSTVQKIRMLSLLFTLNICAGNVGLMYTSVSLREVVRSLTPGITLIFSVWLLKKSFTKEAVWSLFIVMGGVILTAITELDFHLGGFVILLISCILAALKGVTTNMVLVGTGAVHPLYVLYLMSPLALLEMLAMAVMFGEFSRLSAAWDTLPLQTCGAMILATAVMAFFLNVANFNLNKITSPVTVSVAGSFKEVMTIGLSFVIFKNKPTPWNVIGIITALTGTALYHYYAHGRKHHPVPEKKDLDLKTTSADPTYNQESGGWPKLDRVSINSTNDDGEGEDARSHKDTNL